MVVVLNVVVSVDVVDVLAGVLVVVLDGLLVPFVSTGPPIHGLLLMKVMLLLLPWPFPGPLRW